ncbi:MAG: hypothetical protein NWR72_12450 [Bacteroidia bacterium]|nr:hypothetical protein [Bacteroidia bacterium]
MPYRSGLLFLLAVFFLLPHTFSQKILALENPKKFKRIAYQPGDWIRFGTGDGNAKYSGMIEAVDDSVIVIVKTVKIENEGDATNNVFRDYVPIQEITTVYNTDRNWLYFFRNAYSGGAIVGGGALLTIGIVNAVINNQSPEPSSVIIASAISASGLLVRYLGRNKYKIGKTWKLRPMEPMVMESDGEK